MTGDAFVEFARKLLVLPLGACPAGNRSIVSRLYYGVFHAARQFIEDQLGFPHQNFDSNNKHREERLLDTYRQFWI